MVAKLKLKGIDEINHFKSPCSLYSKIARVKVA